MVSLRCVRQQLLRSRRVRRACLAGIALLLAGCAQTEGYRQQAWNLRAPDQDGVVQAPPPAEIEADGLPAQVPPPRSIRQQPDDPAEPYSPNYGTRAPLRQAVHRALPPATIPDDLPADFRRRLVLSARN